MSLPAVDCVKRPRKTRIILPLAVLLLCSCASLRGTRQRVKVASTPSGAEIFQESEKLGTTPAFIELKRKKRNLIVLRKPGHADMSVSLETEYRWGGSFASNLIWLSPVFIGAGVGIDLWTGAAWDYSPLRVLRWDRSRALEPTVLKRVAVAPPQAPNEMLSDELGELVEARARKLYAKAEVSPFGETVNRFARYSYFHQSVTPSDYRDDLYYALGASHIVETDAEVGESEVVLRSRLVDVFTDEVFESFETRVKRSDVHALNEDFFKSQLRSVVSLAPNTIAFNFSQSNVNIDEKNQIRADQYRSRHLRSDGILSVLSGFSLKSVKSSEVMKKWKATFRFVPSIVLGYNQFVFERHVNNELDGVRYQWYQVSAGFGPELGLETPAGLVYFDVIPALGASVVTWSKNGERTDARGTVSVEVELGYLVFISENVNLRFYVNTIGSNMEQWNSILTTSTGRDIKVEAANFGSAGLGIGYYFPEIKTSARKFIR